MIDEPSARWETAAMLGRGVRAVPVLRTGIVATILFAVVGAAGRVAVPIVVQQVVDRGIGDGAVRLGAVAWSVAAGAAVVIGGGWCQRQAVARLGRRAEAALCDLRLQLFGHLHRIGLTDLDDERRGSIVARATADVEAIAQFFAWGALAWLLDGTVVVIVAVVMIAYDWVVAAVAIAMATPLVVLLARTQQRLARAYDDARAVNGEVLAEVGELVDGIEVLHVHGATAGFAERARDASRRRSRAYVSAGSLAARLFGAADLAQALTIVAVVLVGVLRGPGSGLTAGAMVGLVFLVFRFLEPVTELTEVLDQTLAAASGLRRVLGVLDLPVSPPEPEHPRPLPPGPLDIDIAHVWYRYPGRADREPALVDVHVHVAAGQFVALVGATGSGKTTLARLVARFADPTSGRVHLGGVPLDAVADAELRRRLVVVGQEPFLFDGTLAENVRVGCPGASSAEIEAVVAALDLGDWLASLPDGLDTAVGARGERLSAGERQLVALVRAAVADPDVLVLDEATSSVDARTELRLAHALERLSSGRTTIAIAHRLSTAARADRVLVLADGMLVEDGTPAELAAAGGAYTRLRDSWLVAVRSSIEEGP